MTCNLVLAYTFWCPADPIWGISEILMSMGFHPLEWSRRSCTSTPNIDWNVTWCKYIVTLPIIAESYRTDNETMVWVVGLAIETSGWVRKKWPKSIRRLKINSIILKFCFVPVTLPTHCFVSPDLFLLPCRKITPVTYRILFAQYFTTFTHYSLSLKKNLACSQIVVIEAILKIISLFQN